MIITITVPTKHEAKINAAFGSVSLLKERLLSIIREDLLMYERHQESIKIKETSDLVS